MPLQLEHCHLSRTDACEIVAAFVFELVEVCCYFVVFCRALARLILVIGTSEWCVCYCCCQFCVILAAVTLFDSVRMLAIGNNECNTTKNNNNNNNGRSDNI